MKTVSNKPYSRFNPEELILRDLLAADRTILANERTFLAYIRTALTLFVTGVTFIKFFGHIVTEIVGFIFIPLGLFIFAVGLNEYRKMYRMISKLHQAKKNDGSLSVTTQPSNERL